MFASAEAAEAAFYAAFESQDLAAMMAVWSCDESVVCIHPMGPRLLGRAAIERSWAAIFQTDGRLSFSVEQVQTTSAQDIAVHSVFENISFGENQRSLVLATNVYRNSAAGWLMWSHHGSPGQQVVVPSRPQSSPLH